jgi:DEAD/DEAH box helicase domain-containing protein
MHPVVFDLETRNIFSEVGSSDPTALDISVVGVYDFRTDSYSSYFQEDFHLLWPLLEKADMLIGYNSNHFDIPILNKYYHGDLNSIKSLDLLEEIKNSLGRRVSLDRVADGTLNKGKIGHGLQAIEWWKKGDFESLKKYCLEDVKLTKEVYEYALKNNKLKFKEAGKTFEIPLDTSTWKTKEERAMTFSLPF